MNIIRTLPTWLGLARRHPRWTLGGAVALIVMLVLLRGCFQSELKPTAYHQVKRGDFLVTIVEGGTLEAVNEVVIRNEVEGNSRIIYIVPEGSYVKKGDLLVELDTADAEEKLNQQEIEFEKAKAAYVQAEKNLEIEKSVIQSSVDTAKLNVEFAKIDLEKFKQGQRLQELRNAEIEITTAKGDLLLAQDSLDWSVKLFARGFETKNAVDQGSNTVQDLTLRLEKAQTNLWVLTNYDHPKLLRTYESALEEATNQLSRVIAQGEGKIAQLNADLSTQSNSLALIRAKLENDKDQLTKSKICAPQEGLVVYAITQSRWSSQSMIEEGAMVRERQEIIKLPDTAEMKVEVKIHESHINKVHVGQPAFVILDPMPDVRFKGRVSKVAVLPDTQSRFGNPNLKVYKTEVLITEKLSDIKPGVSARAEIIITNIPNTLTVPVQAVTTLKGQTVVYVKRGHKPEPVPVTVGMFNSKFIEIQSGVREGDLVLLSPPFDVQEKDLGGAIVDDQTKLPEAEGQPGPPANAAGPPPGASGSPGRSGINNNRRPSSGRGGEGRQRGNDDESRGPADRRRGGPGAGEASADRRSGGRGGPNRAAMMKRFDKNGDGKLDDNERAALRAQFGGGERRPRSEASAPNN